MRAFEARNARNLLLVSPAYSPSFGTFEYAFPLLGVRAFMPPQGLLLIAALLPQQWSVRFVDENIRRVKPEEFAWADAVLISGMHLQRKQILEINQRAHRAGKLTVLGGPSVSAAPEFYPEIDILHRGEAGDGTSQLLEHLDQSTERSGKQIIFVTAERLKLSALPSPAYHLVDFKHYMLATIQFASGCPFSCDYCDIPALYGRRPRFKTPRQIVAELEQIVGKSELVYFVDDNFVASPAATKELLEQLVQWQRLHHHPLRFSCEATLDLACHPQLLELMREARFATVFCGVETPKPSALRQIHKAQNLRTPMLQAIRTLNRYGLEVAIGIILGLDTDTTETPGAIIRFVQDSQTPLTAVNLLYALPQTPLYNRLVSAGRIVADDTRDSNVQFSEPYQVVQERWRRVVAEIYEPRKLYARFATQSTRTYCHRYVPPHPWKNLSWRTCRRATGILARLIWHVGVRGDYRQEFWKMFWAEAKKGEIERIFHVGVVAHHLVIYARQCLNGRIASSNYSYSAESR